MELAERLLELGSTGPSVTLLWRKGHHRCTGNHLADRIANLGTVMSSTSTPTLPIPMCTNSSKATEIKTWLKHRSHQQFETDRITAGRTFKNIFKYHDDGIRIAKSLSQNTGLAQLIKKALPMYFPIISNSCGCGVKCNAYHLIFKCPALSCEQKKLALMCGSRK